MSFIMEIVLLRSSSQYLIEEPTKSLVSLHHILYRFYLILHHVLQNICYSFSFFHYLHFLECMLFRRLFLLCLALIQNVAVFFNGAASIISNQMKHRCYISLTFIMFPPFCCICFFYILENIMQTICFGFLNISTLYRFPYKKCYTNCWSFIFFSFKIR